ncbi:MAG: GNAT family N-acetyltransferase [Bacteroidales bacterium]|jgi:ribosomal protein S18 acetylase RimI-like enzyme|nr:GNAT family N-acetyltransferase [Bacteroidales bacterium]
MIRFATEKDTENIKSIWKICFGDTDEFINLFFSKKYCPENTLLFLENNLPVSALQILNYDLKFIDKIFPINYICGICTLSEFRNKGIASKLINYSHKVSSEKKIPISILIPANENLIKFYEHFGYQQVFEENNENYSLKKLIEETENLEIAYKKFCDLFSDKDILVLKTFEDFKTIVSENKISNFESKTSCLGLAKILDFEFILKIFASQNIEKSFSIEISDLKQCFYIDKGKILKYSNLNPDFKLNSRMFCRLVFGYKINELEEKFQVYFPEYQTEINFMLE